MDKKVLIGAALLAGLALTIGKQVSAEEPPMEFECPHCDEVFSSLEELIAHIESAHSNISTNEFVCPYCSNSYQTIVELVEHLTNEHPDQGAFQVVDMEWQ